MCEFAKGPAAGDLGSRVRATNVAGASGVQNSTYTPDEYKFEMLSPDVVVMTHRPGKIKDVIKINMARPRNIFEIHRQEGFDDAYGRLWQIFRHELNIGRASAQDS